MKATWNGVTLAESDDTVVVEGNHYFPESSLKREYTTFSNHRSMCPWKGEAHYYSVMVNGDLNPNAVWYYPEPSEAAREIKGRVAFWKGVKVERRGQRRERCRPGAGPLPSPAAPPRGAATAGSVGPISPP